jgi:hypothetical protein
VALTVVERACMGVVMLQVLSAAVSSTDVVCDAVVQGSVRPPDAQTDPKVGHVGPVNDLVQCGPYICSAGEPGCFALSFHTDLDNQSTIMSCLNDDGQSAIKQPADMVAFCLCPLAHMRTCLELRWHSDSFNMVQEQHVLGAHVCGVSAGGDTTVRVWRASDLSLARVLRGHRGSVLSLLAVGNVLLSGSRDNTIRWATVQGLGLWFRKYGFKVLRWATVLIWMQCCTPRAASAPHVMPPGTNGPHVAGYLCCGDGELLQVDTSPLNVTLHTR